MDYKEILEYIDVGLVFTDTVHLEGRGYYLPNAKTFGNNGGLVIDGLLDSDALEFTVLHECGHLLKGQILSELSAPQLHIINECKANRFMIHTKAVDWLKELDFMVVYFTPERFLERFGLSVKKFYELARQEMSKIVEEFKSQLVY